jgi:hypothetical protein
MKNPGEIQKVEREITGDLGEKQGDPWDIWGDLEETWGNSSWQVQGTYKEKIRENSEIFGMADLREI